MNTREVTQDDIAYILKLLDTLDELNGLLARLQLKLRDLTAWLSQQITNHPAQLLLVGGDEYRPLGIIGLLHDTISKGDIELVIWFDYQTILKHNLLLKTLIAQITQGTTDLHTLTLFTAANKPFIQEFVQHAYSLSLMQQPNVALHTNSPLHKLYGVDSNQFYIKRDDLIPFSLGGNKARKAYYFFAEILQGHYQTVVTYGSHQSNHCRVVANMCSMFKLGCVIISPHSNEPKNTNQQLIQLSGATVIHCDLTEVRQTIQDTCQALELAQQKPFFIPGGGHGNEGTQAYIDAFGEISDWESRAQETFDYIFLASGTGTTQAGLIIGQLLHQRMQTKIIGISVARASNYGTAVIQDSIQAYLDTYKYQPEVDFNDFIHFYDHYTVTPYGQFDQAIQQTAKDLYTKYSIPMSRTYTAKAYTGMMNYIHQHKLRNKNILFLHTGGIPLFFDDV